MVLDGQVRMWHCQGQPVITTTKARYNCLCTDKYGTQDRKAPKYKCEVEAQGRWRRAWTCMGRRGQSAARQWMEAAGAEWNMYSPGGFQPPASFVLGSAGETISAWCTPS